MARRKKQRPRGSLTTIGACFLAFVLGMGFAWWFTDHRAGAETEPHQPIAGPTDDGFEPDVEAPTTLTDPGPVEPDPEEEPLEEQTRGEFGDPLSPLPPRPVEPNPLWSARLLPEDIVKTGSGKFDVASGSGEPTGANVGGNLRRYTVEVEEDLPFDADDAAEFIESVLADERGWTRDDKHQFQRVSDDSFHFRIIIATPDTVDELCAPLNTNGEVSCGRAGRATLNGLRWALGVGSFGDDLENYRRYLVNHEVGHLLGYPHRTCPGPGQLAPVMVQQTISTQQCEPNPWPHPESD